MVQQAQSGLVIGPTVPQGFTWVVRDVRMVNLNRDQGVHVDQLTLSVFGGPVITASPWYFSVAGQLYPWHGRAILQQGEAIQAFSNSANWTLVADGYQLTLI